MWTVGFNMPGYMPESEPVECETYEEARCTLMADLEWALENEGLGETDFNPDDFEEAMARVSTLADKNVPYGETVGKYHYWLDWNA